MTIELFNMTDTENEFLRSSWAIIGRAITTKEEGILMKHLQSFAGQPLKMRRIVKDFVAGLASAKVELSQIHPILQEAVEASLKWQRARAGEKTSC